MELREPWHDPIAEIPLQWEVREARDVLCLKSLRVDEGDDLCQLLLSNNCPKLGSKQ